MTLFDRKPADPWEDIPTGAPLAETMRPRLLAEIVGQDEILGEGKWLQQAVADDRLPSLILWGPPGTGKTTLARVIARTTKAVFEPFSAVTGGVKEVRRIMAAARERAKLQDRRTILFIDEIHRFNKAQQDAFLQHVERGDIVLIGATTENPSFEVNGALLSRSRTLVLRPIPSTALVTLLQRALHDQDRGLGKLNLEAPDEVMELLAQTASGDARRALNTLEEVATLTKKRKSTAIDKNDLEAALGKRTLLYDKSGEEHFNLISALHKSLRSSDPQAALYWFERMLAAGEDPLYITRRLVRFAVEDIGLADPSALRIILAAKDAFQFLGLPEGKLALAQALIYLAVAPRSDRVYQALGKVEKEVKNGWADQVPKQLRNAPTSLMKELDYGKGYEHAHKCKDGVPAMECLPERLAGQTFYHPSDQGLEKKIATRITEINTARNQARKK